MNSTVMYILQCMYKYSVLRDRSGESKPSIYIATCTSKHVEISTNAISLTWFCDYPVTIITYF